MTSFRRRAVIAVTISAIVVELALAALNYFYRANGFVEAVTVIVNLPGEIAVALFMIFGGGWIVGKLPHWEYTGELLMVIGAAISVGTWALLTWIIFRKDQSDLLTSFYEAVLVDRLTLFAILLFLGTGIWFWIAMAGEDDATAPAIVCSAALCFVGYARRRSRFE